MSGYSRATSDFPLRPQWPHLGSNLPPLTVYAWLPVRKHMAHISIDRTHALNRLTHQLARFVPFALRCAAHALRPNKRSFAHGWSTRQACDVSMQGCGFRGHSRGPRSEPEGCSWNWTQPEESLGGERSDAVELVMCQCLSRLSVEVGSMLLDLDLG
jgi:hypothetical protein